MSRLVDLFIQLVKIDSPTGDERAMADFLLAYFSQKKITAEKDTVGNVFVRIPGVGEPLFLSAHMDTVEPGRGIVPVVSDGVIRSKDDTILGADNKVTIAVILEVIERLKNKNHRPLEIVFTVDEEARNTGALGFDYTKLKAKKGMIADVALPVGTIIVRSAAYMQIDIELRGKSAHASVPEKAKSIIPALAEFLTEVHTGHLDEQTTCTIGFGTFGSTRNTVPAVVSLQAEMRGFDEKILQSYKQQIREQVKKIAKQHRVEAKTFFHIEQRVYNFAKTDPWVQSLAQIMQQQNIVPTYAQSWGVSDGNYFDEKGLHVVNLGDGTKDAHTTRESIAIADLEKLAAIFETVTTIL